MFENRRWVIIDKDDISSVDFSKVIETSADTLDIAMIVIKPLLNMKAINHHFSMVRIHTIIVKF